MSPTALGYPDTIQVVYLPDAELDEATITFLNLGLEPYESHAMVIGSLGMFTWFNYGQEIGKNFSFCIL